MIEQEQITAMPQKTRSASDHTEVSAEMLPSPRHNFRDRSDKSAYSTSLRLEVATRRHALLVSYSSAI